MSGWRRNEQEQSHGYIVWVSPLRQRTIDDIRLRKLSEQTQSYYMRWASGGLNWRCRGTFEVYDALPVLFTAPRLGPRTTLKGPLCESAGLVADRVSFFREHLERFWPIAPLRHLMTRSACSRMAGGTPIPKRLAIF